MKESIWTDVVDNDDIDTTLEIRYVDDALVFILAGQPVFSGDWAGNFFYVFKRALELWAEYK